MTQGNDESVAHPRLRRAFVAASIAAVVLGSISMVVGFLASIEEAATPRACMDWVPRYGPASASPEGTTVVATRAPACLDPGAVLPLST